MSHLPFAITRSFAILMVIVWGGIAGDIAAQRMRAFDLMRRRMVETQLKGRGIRDRRVLRAMSKVPRHLFVPRNQREFAYRDAALPIGHGQTITSPYVVAYMTEQLDPQPTDKVLEIGTGSGYQASVLSRIVDQVYSIEIVEPLGNRAARVIRQLRYDNVHTKIGDGYQGWPEHAPFDKVIVTCSPEKVPPALVDQLREGGRLIVPLGERFQQSLYLFRKNNGALEKERLEATFFVPMTGQAEQLRTQKGNPGWPEIVNGGFEQKSEGGEPKGWFYVRQAKVTPEPSAPEGEHVLLLSNRVLGKKCHAVQAFGVDGRKLKAVEISVWVRAPHMNEAARKDVLPRIEISFYDENRSTIENAVMGPWARHRSWLEQTLEIPVPAGTRLGTVAIGMFGARGQVMIDQLRIRGIGKSSDPPDQYVEPASGNPESRQGSVKE
ncbi:MAG: protein-L-isoaspartate(D-aspartate) O-methyltransferase [Pirellulaceae bacterium]